MFFYFIPAQSTTRSRSDYINLKKCEYCQIEIPINEYRFHLRTNLHKCNCILKSEYENINIIATAFKNRIMSYRLNPSGEYLMPETFLMDSLNDIIKIISDCLVKHKCIKLNLELFAYFMKSTSDERELKSFMTKYEIVYQSTDIKELFMNAIYTFERKISELEHCESGWSCVLMSHLEININKYSPLRGGSYIDLPSKIKNTKSCINIKNNDNFCFLWSVVASLFPQNKNVCRIGSYPHFSTVLNIDGMTFPPTYKDIKLFEKLNKEVSINVYGLDNKDNVTGPLYVTSTRKLDHINLLYVEKNGKGHYCLIKDLIRLVKHQVTLNKGKIFLCELCLQFFTSEKKYHSHMCNEILTVLPEKNTTLNFKNYERQQKINFVIYADFESVLLNHDICQTENTRVYKLHKPSCFGYYICCSHDSNLNKYVSYRGPDCEKVFIEYLISDIEKINDKLSFKKPMTPLSPMEEENYKNASKCHICGHFLFGDKVRDHDHITSQYRGAAHSRCNLLYKVCQFVPVIIHNLSGYDCHLFIQELAKYDGSFKIIPRSKEKYTSVTKIINTKNSSCPIQIKFIDSFQFLSSSLNDLSKNLIETDFVSLTNEFHEKEQVKLLCRKGIYPYDYMDNFSKYEDDVLPPQKTFYNSIKCEHITDEEYEHAKNVWDKFKIKSLGEYTDLYLKTDVLSLCDIFENFRNTCLRYYKLDPAYYITAPSLSWDAMLLCTGVQLELISDLEIYEMIEKGIRGGLSQCSLRNAKANNKYLPNFDNSQPSTYLIYLDCNNLYGYAMTKKLPISNFRFLTAQEIDNLNVFDVPDDSHVGYILEVDLAYPDHLHNAHRDLPFAAEKFIPPGGKAPKLIASLYDKFKYVIHYVHLKECLKNGLQLKKIHRVITFTQENYLQKYIDLNTCLRQASSSNFEKDFFKLLNNAIFGKTIENRRKQVDIKLVTHWRDEQNITNKKLGAEKLIAKPNMKNITVFSENFAAIHLSPEKLSLDRPIYIGFTVLEYAKQHLYKFHYDFIKTKYQNKARLCYTDTDSLLYLVKTTDFYDDIKKNISNFDTSNFELNNCYQIPRVNAKIPGLFKDELGGEVISEFTGLRAKLYCINTKKGEVRKAKGVTNSIKKKLHQGYYKTSLFNNKSFKCKMNVIKSIKHVLYSQQVDKVVINRNDDKVQVLPNQIETIPWGHCSTIF